MAAKAIARFSISFGLINIPVALMSAAREDRIKLHKVCEVHKCKIRQKTVCSEGGEELASTAKGYDLAGRTIILTEEELASAAAPLCHAFEIEACVRPDALDARYFEKPYFVVPAAKAAGATYVLLRDALVSSGRIGIGRVTIRTKQHIAALRVLGDALVLHLLYWPEELVIRDEYEIPSGSADAAQLAFARQLVDAMPDAFEPETYPNQAQRNLEMLIEAKVKGAKSPFSAVPAPAETAADSLMELLQASVARMAA